MSDTAVLESLSDLLPEERREQFFKFVSKFRSRPEDDDHFQLLEAIGFIMLVMREIPEQVAAIIDQAQGKLGQSETEQLRSDFVAVLHESLDTPSYKDLREAVLSIRDQEARFRQKVSDLQSLLERAEQTARNKYIPVCTIVGGLLIGLTSALSTVALVFPWTSQSAPKEPGTTPEKLRPYAALLEHGQLDYFEVDMPNRGRVAMYMIGGGVQETFVDGDHGVVIRALDTAANRADER